jgi:hypothetical protein
MSDYGDCRKYLELIKEHAGKLGWTLEQTADLFDAFMKISKSSEWPNVKELLANGPTGKQ